MYPLERERDNGEIHSPHVRDPNVVFEILQIDPKHFERYSVEHSYKNQLRLEFDPIPIRVNAIVGLNKD